MAGCRMRCRGPAQASLPSPESPGSSSQRGKRPHKLRQRQPSGRTLPEANTRLPDSAQATTFRAAQFFKPKSNGLTELGRIIEADSKQLAVYQRVLSEQQNWQVDS